MPLASGGVQWIPVATQNKLLRKPPKSLLVGLTESEKVAGAVYCDESTSKVICHPKGCWELRTMLAVEKCGSKDDQRKQGSDIFRPPFFDRLFWCLRRCQHERDPSSTPAKFLKHRGTEITEGRRSL
jgi:hypothetical protein